MKKKNAKQLLSRISRTFKVTLKQLFESLPTLEQAETQGIRVLFLNGKLLLAEVEPYLFPTLVFHQLFPYLSKIVVDMGAVSHICNGADVMAPGIVRVEGDFDEQDVILVVDERHKKILAVAIALIDSNALRSIKYGKVAKNVHHVGDKLWKHYG